MSYTLYKRPDSEVWWVNMQYPTTGKRTRKSTKTTDRKLAEQRAADMAGRQDQEQAPEAVTVSKAFESMWESITSTSAKARRLST